MIHVNIKKSYRVHSGGVKEVKASLDYLDSHPDDRKVTDAHYIVTVVDRPDLKRLFSVGKYKQGKARRAALRYMNRHE